MVDVSTDIVINRPLAEVSEYAGNPENAPEWYENIKSAEWKTPSVVEIGAQIEFTAGFLGRKLTYVYEITEFDPPTRLVMRTAEGPFPMETTYYWEEAGSDKTKMTLRNRGHPSGFSKLITPFMSLAISHANNKDLKLLKLIFE